MIIDEALLEAYGAERLYVKRKTEIFKIDRRAEHYYQIDFGTVKMNNFNEDGKEFVQGIFRDGNSFGEPPLFNDKKYPASAVALEDSCVWKLQKQQFFKLLRENPETHLRLTQVLADRLHYKATMVAEISSEVPEHRLLKLIDYLKKNLHQLEDHEPYQVELSRQQMADLTGLRVETVIRAVKSLEKKGEIQLENHKVVR